MTAHTLDTAALVAMAAAAVAEVRGEHAEERLTPQTVIDTRTVERAALAPNTSPLVQEHHAPAPAAPMVWAIVLSVSIAARGLLTSSFKFFNKVPAL